MSSLSLGQHSSVSDAVSSLQAIIQQSDVGGAEGGAGRQWQRNHEALQHLRNAGSAANTPPGFMPSGQQGGH